MANEGSTKPTYSELESDVRRWKDASDANRDEAMKQQDGKLLWKQRHDRLLADYKASESELLRVRGLLQRYGSHDHGCAAYCSNQCDCGWRAASSQGAESADIGKLDSVDDEISFDQQLLEELENQIAHRGGCGFEFGQLQNVRACVLDALCVVNRKLAGSAETGGEKA